MNSDGPSVAAIFSYVLVYLSFFAIQLRWDFALKVAILIIVLYYYMPQVDSRRL